MMLAECLFFETYVSTFRITKLNVKGVGPRKCKCSNALHENGAVGFIVVDMDRLDRLGEGWWIP